MSLFIAWVLLSLLKSQDLARGESLVEVREEGMFGECIMYYMKQGMRYYGD